MLDVPVERERERERESRDRVSAELRSEKKPVSFLVLFFFTQDADSSEDNHYPGSGT